MMFPDGATRGLCSQFNIPSTYWLISSHTCILVSIQVHFKKKKTACSSSGCLCGRHHLLSSETCIPKQVSAATIVSFPLKSFRPHLRSKSLTAAGRRDRFCRAIQKKKASKNRSQERWRRRRICGEAIQFHAEKPEMNAPIIFSDNGVYTVLRRD